MLGVYKWGSSSTEPSRGRGVNSYPAVSTLAVPWETLLTECPVTTK